MSTYRNTKHENLVLVSIPLNVAARAEQFLMESRGITFQQAVSAISHKIAYELWWPAQLNIGTGDTVSKVLRAIEPDPDPNIVLSNN